MSLDGETRLDCALCFVDPHLMPDWVPVCTGERIPQTQQPLPQPRPRCWCDPDVALPAAALWARGKSLWKWRLDEMQGFSFAVCSDLSSSIKTTKKMSARLLTCFENCSRKKKRLMFLRKWFAFAWWKWCQFNYQFEFDKQQVSGGLGPVYCDLAQQLDLIGFRPLVILSRCVILKDCTGDHRLPLNRDSSSSEVVLISCKGISQSTTATWLASLCLPKVTNRIRAFAAGLPDSWKAFSTSDSKSLELGVCCTFY